MLQAHDRGIWCYEPGKPPSGFAGASDKSKFENGDPSRVKVLIVDDESTIAETLVEILNGEGFEAITASAGDSALASAQTFGPDIVISDVVMPGMSGVELGIELRRILPRCRIILFSGQTATVDLLREARKRGHEFEIVAKPIKPQTLISMIRHRSN
jgi:DNA-binding NtrC family response regulator